MIETRCLKNVVIFVQTILSFVLSRKTYYIYDNTNLSKRHFDVLYEKYQVTFRKKSHTCEEGTTHLRIYFWHLLRNLKNKYFI